MMKYAVRLPGARQAFVGMGGIVAIAGSCMMAQASAPPASARPSRSDDTPLSGGKVEAGPDGATESIKLFRQHCIDCHDADGRGESAREISSGAPDFTDPRWHASRADHELARVIWTGKKSMPSMKTKLTREHIDKLVTLIRGFRGGRQRINEEYAVAESVRAEPHLEPLQASALRTDHSPAPAAGATRLSETPPGPAHLVFQRYCVRCHGAGGDGSSQRSNFHSIPDFTSKTWQEQHGESSMKLSILEGKGSAMPPFGGRIDEQAATELVAFLKSLAGMAPARRQNSSHGFDDRFQRLMEELEALKREYRTLSSAAERRNDVLSDGSRGQAAAREERMARAAGKR
jgi:mono/diheme cytochrome c family protein